MRLFHPKMVTRFALVVKIEHFSLQNGDEIESRRQKIAVFTKNGDEIRPRRQKQAFLTQKW
jgi:hypothetical protein